MSELWTEKFNPKTTDTFIGNSDIVTSSVDWVKKWQNNENQPPLLLWGQTGSGKTSLAYLLAKQFNWNVVELNNSDLRSKDVIERVVGAATQNASFFGSRRMILIDEVDALTRTDRGGAAAIASIIKTAKNPVILTANDIFSNKNISALRFICKAFEFKKINYLSMAKRLREILDEEKISFDEEAIKELAKNANGDMRSALLDIQILALDKNISMEDVDSLGSRDRQQKIFTVMKAIFKGTDFSEIRNARTKTDLSNDMLFRWVEENIPRQYKDKDTIALAFNRLSRADVFNGRIFNRQHWGFLRYSSALASEGVGLAKKEVSHDFVAYQFPGLLSMLSRTSGIRAMKKSMGKKIGSKMHSSSRAVISKDLPFLQMIFQNREKAVSLTALFELDEKEVAFLLNTKSDTKKVKTIISDAQEIREESAKPKRFFNQPVLETQIPDLDSEIDSKLELKEEPEEEHGAKQTTLF
ncbi:MAG: replication factor C large subunit [archaeon]|nr:replication factor C large subunit [archaeon]